MKLMEEIKGHSSKWIKSKGKDFENFYWQNGYGAFSVYAKDVHLVIDYIKSQKEHHSGVPFQDEFRTLMNENGITYEEKYVWD